MFFVFCILFYFLKNNCNQSNCWGLLRGPRYNGYRLSRSSLVPQPVFLNEVLVKLPDPSSDEPIFHISHIDRVYILKTDNINERYTHVCMHTCTHTHAHRCTHLHSQLHSDTHTRMHLYTITHIYLICTYTYKQKHTHMKTYAHTHAFCV